MAEGEETKVNITYETLFELLRREKNREELQTLSETFFEDVVKYLSDKKEMTNSKSEFFGDDKEKIHLQIQNIKKILGELYERREKKIINMALLKSRTNGLVNKESMLKEEITMFESINQLLNCYRSGIITNLKNAVKPAINTEIAQPKQAESTNGSGQPEEKNESITIRFMSPIPKFVGPNLEVFGPFDEDDVACLPNKIADVLINKGRAEAMNGEGTP